MAQRLRRNTSTKRVGNIHDHIAFILLVLLAALVYSDHANHFVSNNLIFYAVLIGIVILALFVSLKIITRMRVRRDLISSNHLSIDTMHGIEFERYIARLLPRLGYRHIRLTERYDLGLDIVAEKGNIRWGIQVKRQSYPVKIEAVRQAVAALNHYKCDRSMVITNNNFSPAARQLANSNDCILVDRQQLLSWINL
jgi:restriction system protein